MLTLPSPARPPLPDLIALVTSLATRKVTRIDRNIHIIGCSVRSARPTGMRARDGMCTAAGSLIGGRPRGASPDPTTAASTRTAPPAHLMRGFYARSGQRGRAAFAWGLVPEIGGGNAASRGRGADRYQWAAQTG